MDLRLLRGQFNMSQVRYVVEASSSPQNVLLHYFFFKFSTYCSIYWGLWTIDTRGSNSNIFFVRQAAFESEEKCSQRPMTLDFNELIRVFGELLQFDYTPVWCNYFF